MRDDAADWYNEVAATITRWDANGGNGDGNFCVELRKRYTKAYATRFKKLLNKVAPDNDIAMRFKINYFIRGLNPLIAGRTYESNPNTLDGAITQARAIETGNNFFLQNELTKQSEELKIAKLEKEIRSLKGEVFGIRNKMNTNNKLQFDYRKAKCFTCGKIGHTSKFCKELSSKRMNIYNY
ncbi:hypothetical protein RclHR1_07420001 [Rhizophagus clarus]|uniref:CCHC-type domain-containing protein n=1 Tax=Rhizophagus clarus TaxID=94130 RepID=A0A2Z6SKY6_9GLOM|nr:hypothetical protein RclHR1_07420001 [Rhizophagus clarus]